MGGGDHDTVLPLGDLGGEVHDVLVAPVVVDEYEALYAMIRKATDGIEEYVEERLVAVGDCAGELHMVGTVSCPRGVEADAVCLLRHVVYELGDSYAVAAEGEVDGMLLD